VEGPAEAGRHVLKLLVQTPLFIQRDDADEVAKSCAVPHQILYCSLQQEGVSVCRYPVEISHARSA